jgi:hypothetical protein
MIVPLMSLDLVILTQEAASSYEQALSIYHSEDEEGDPATPELKEFADEIDVRFGDDDWPFTVDPLLFPDHVSLEIARQRWGGVVPDIVGLARTRRLVVLDPQYERLFPPGTNYE